VNREEIKRITLHRDPMLLVDEATVEDGVYTGKYTTRGDEWFLLASSQRKRDMWMGNFAFPVNFRLL